MRLVFVPADNQTSIFQGRNKPKVNIADKSVGPMGWYYGKLRIMEVELLLIRYWNQEIHKSLWWHVTFPVGFTEKQADAGRPELFS